MVKNIKNSERFFVHFGLFFGVKNSGILVVCSEGDPEVSDDSERSPPSLDLAALAMRSGDEAWPDVCFFQWEKNRDLT